MIYVLTTDGDEYARKEWDQMTVNESGALILWNKAGVIVTAFSAKHWMRADEKENGNV